MANFTKQAIKISFMKLLNEKPFNKISVRDIVEDCGINRNSFYYHFRDIPALTEEIIMEETNRMLEKYPTLDSLHVFVDEIAKTCKENKRALLHIFNSVSRDVYEEHVMRMCDEIVKKYANTAFCYLPLDKNERRIGNDAVKCMLFGFSIDWISNGLKEEYVKDLHAMCDLIYDFLRHMDNIKTDAEVPEKDNN